MQGLKDLWLGHLPLEIAFWKYAIIYGLALNVAATAVALFLVVLDVPIAYALIVHLLPVPYGVLAICGVWRSADHSGGRRDFSAFAKAGVVAWYAFWLVA